VTFDAIGSTDVSQPSAGSSGAPVNVAAAFTRLDRSCINAAGYEVFKEQ